MDTTPPVVIPTSEIVVRLADEGIPIYAISRSLKLPAEDVREYIQAALDDGIIVDHPREDWSPGAHRTSRIPDIDGFFGNEEGLYRTCAKFFGTTRQQSIVLGMLLRRAEVTKDHLHTAIERDRPDGKEDTGQKLVDVLICILRRRKLRKFAKAWHGDEDYKIIRTNWGNGYYILPQDRTRAIAELHAFANSLRSTETVPEEVKEAA